MNKNSLFNKTSDFFNRIGVSKIILWLSIHLVIALLFLLLGNKPVEFNILKILPQNQANKDFVMAETNFSDSSSKKMLVAIAGSSVEVSHSLADLFVTAIRTRFVEDSIVYKINDDSLKKIVAFFDQYKYQFLSDEEVTNIESNDFDQLNSKAMEELYSPLGLGSKDNVQSDPFLFSSIHLKNFLLNNLSNGSSIYLQDGYLTSFFDNKYWSIITINAGSGLSLGDVNDLPQFLIHNLEELQIKNPVLTYHYSGVPFHTSESTASSKGIIGFISTVSLILISFCFIFVFRSILSLIVVNLTLAIGVFSGLAMTFVFFDAVHILTIVFGTSLIGISIDYSLHFFAERASSKIKLSSQDIIQRILPGISFGILTSIISYIAFIITNFSILQQVAVFSIFGLTSSYLSVILLYHYLPLVKKPIRSTRTIGIKLLSFFGRLVKLPAIWKIAISVLVSVIIAIGAMKFEVNNKISSFYQVSDNMKMQESTMSEITNFKSKGQYIIVKGRSVDELLDNDARLSELLKRMVSKGLSKYYVSLSQYLSSRHRQDQVFLRTELNMQNLLIRQAQALGFDEEESKAAITEYSKSRINYLELDDFMNLPFSQNLKSLFLGRIEENYYSIAVVFDQSPDLNLANELAGLPFAYLVDKIHDAENYLNNMSLITVILLVISYLIIFVFFIFRYGLSMSLKVSAVPFLASVMTVFIISALGVSINIFVIFALILIPGMGIDFALFFKETQNAKSSTMIAITISMISTVMSFGLLFFAPFASSFGLAVAIGILLSFLLTPVFVRKH